MNINKHNHFTLRITQVFTQQLRDKWNIKKKGYLKIHIAVDIKSKKILSMKVTDEHVHDNKMLPQLIEDVTKSNHMSASKVFADGAYDSNNVFRYLAADNGILPCIKVRKNAKVRLKTNHILRNLSELYLKEKQFAKMERHRKLWKEMDC